MFDIRSIISLGISLACLYLLIISKFRRLQEYFFNESVIRYMFMVALLYVCQIAKEEQTLHTYLKKGWEGTHHHDNTGRSRIYAIKKMEAMLCIPVSRLQCGHKNMCNIV